MVHIGQIVRFSTFHGICVPIYHALTYCVSAYSIEKKSLNLTSKVAKVFVHKMYDAA